MVTAIATVTKFKSIGKDKDRYCSTEHTVNSHQLDPDCASVLTMRHVTSTMEYVMASVCV
jgi:hypothetical protein